MNEKFDSSLKSKEKFKLFIPGKPKTHQQAADEKLNIKNIVNKKLTNSEDDDCSKKNKKSKSSNDEFKFEPTPPPDPRFQQTNQTMRCYVMYTDFYKCENILGKDNDACKMFKNIYQKICPSVWINHWDELRENNIMPWPKSYLDQIKSSKK